MEIITQNKETQDNITPALALEILKQGSGRFLNNSMLNRNFYEQIEATTEGQWPFAAILSCIDSRVPTETIFDQGIGDVFNVRVAGNIINPDVLGSLEYACKVAGSKLVVVLGHTGCGAVKGACDNVELGNITGLLAHVKPAINATEEPGDRSSSNTSFVSKVIDKNVELMIERIKDESPILKEMAEQHEIAIVGATYDVSSGNITWS
jgi:carbonic anhydrase